MRTPKISYPIITFIHHSHHPSISSFSHHIYIYIIYTHISTTPTPSMTPHQPPKTTKNKYIIKTKIKESISGGFTNFYYKYMNVISSIYYLFNILNIFFSIYSLICLHFILFKPKKKFLFL